MKAQKVLSLDIEVIEDLAKLKNASRLVNQLVKNYFYSENPYIQDLKDKIKKNKEEVQERKEIINNLNERLKVLEEKEKEFKKLFKGLPPEVLEDFKAFPKMSETILQERFRSIYIDYNGLDYRTVLEAYNNYYNKEKKEVKK